MSGQTRILTGRILTGLVSTFLVVDGLMKFVHPPQMQATMSQLGWPTDAAAFGWTGAILLVATFLHLVPRTSVLGAVLLTGYLGGAVSAHARVGNPVFSHLLLPVYIGAMVWAGLALRDERVWSALLGPKAEK